MSFEENIRPRLERYRREADVTLQHVAAVEEVASKFAGRLFDGLEFTAGMLEKSGFEIQTEVGERHVRIALSAGPGASSEAVFALLPGAAAETDEYLMHEHLSRHTLDAVGYSGRILGWNGREEGPCQVFSVYADGTWRTKGVFVEKSRGKLDDPDEVLWGFCMRIMGRLVDIAAPTSGSGRVWETDGYSHSDCESGFAPPVRTRWLK